RGEVPDEEAEMAERVLAVVAEDPEEQEVAEDVLPARVHEHPREHPLPPRQRVEAGRQPAGAVERARVVAVAEDVDVDARRLELPEPDEEAGDDQPDRDERRRPAGNAVAEREHRRSLRILRT